MVVPPPTSFLPKPSYLLPLLSICVPCASQLNTSKKRLGMGSNCRILSMESDCLSPSSFCWRHKQNHHLFLSEVLYRLNKWGFFIWGWWATVLMSYAAYPEILVVVDVHLIDELLFTVWRRDMINRSEYFPVYSVWFTQSCWGWYIFHCWATQHTPSFLMRLM